MDIELDRYTTEISHCEQFCDTGLALWQHEHRQDSEFAILAPVAFDLAALASQAYVKRASSVCGDTCAGKRNRTNINLKQRVSLRINWKYLADVLL